MASITKFKDGKRIIQFIGADGIRKTIRLGPVSLRVAEFLKVRVEALVSTTISGCSLDPETSRWLATLDNLMLQKLSVAGLIPQSEVMTLKRFLDSYINSRSDTKPATHLLYGHIRRNMLEFFGEKRPMRDITPGDADELRLYLLNEGLAENTVRRRCGMARQFFRAAVRKDIISRNPFSDMKVSILPNPSRMYFVSRAAAQKIFDACPDAEWRLIFALCRFGGLRCPSD